MLISPVNPGYVFDKIDLLQFFPADIMHLGIKITIYGTYDHNFVINGTGFREAAVLQSKESGIRMTCFTDQPGMQLYVANQPIEVTGKNGTQYACHTSVCLETQHFPDAINHDNFPSIVLTPDEPFRSKTLYHFSTF